MASFVRIIPNTLYDSLYERGLIPNEREGESESEENKLLSRLPHAIRDEAKSVLNEYGLEWNKKLQLLINSFPVPGSNVIDLLSSFILQDKKLHSLPGSEVFSAGKTIQNNSPSASPSPPPSTSNNNNSWDSFETSFGNGILNKKKIPKHKDAGSFARRKYFSKK